MTVAEIIGPSNPEIGNAWTAAILGTLFERWPKRQDFNVMDVSTKTGVHALESEEEELFDDLILFLEQELYINVGQRSGGNALGVALTGKGYAVLGSTPESLAEPLGNRLKAVATGAATEGGRQAIATAVGLAFGAAVKALSS